MSRPALDVPSSFLPTAGPNIPHMAPTALSRKEGWALSICWQHFLKQHRRLLALFAQGHWLMFNLVLTRSPTILFCRAAAPLCTCVEVYSSLDFGLCNTSQKNREKNHFQSYAHTDVHCHAPLSSSHCFVSCKKSHCQHIYQTVTELLPVLVCVCVCAKWTHYVSISSAWEHVRTFTKVCAQLCRPVS